MPRGALIADQNQSPITRYFAYTFAVQAEQRLRQKGWTPGALAGENEADSLLFHRHGTPTLIYGLRPPGREKPPSAPGSWAEPSSGSYRPITTDTPEDLQEVAMALLDIRNLRVAYGPEGRRTEVLRGLDLHVDPGEIVGMLGNPVRVKAPRPWRSPGSLRAGRAWCGRTATCLTAFPWRRRTRSS